MFQLVDNYLFIEFENGIDKLSSSTRRGSQLTSPQQRSTFLLLLPEYPDRA